MSHQTSQTNQESELYFECLLDIESSGIGSESYPMEIAWYNPSEQPCDCFLIKPAQKWIWWDDLSEELYHGIARSERDADGVAAEVGARRLNHGLRDQTIAVDGFEWDTFWLSRLFTEARVQPEFHVVRLFPDPPEFERPHRALFRLGKRRIRPIAA